MTATTCRDCGASTPGTERCILHDPESFPPQEAEPGFTHHSHTWTTGCELEFVRNLALNKPRALKGGYRPEAWPQYARIVLEGYREYGPGVDIYAVRDEVRRLL
jgi:hypothetical protein